MARTATTLRPLIRQVAGAIVFNRTSQYIDLGNAGPISTVTGSFTLSAWFKRSVNSVQSVVGDRGSGAIQHFTINFNTSYRSVPLVTTSGGGTAFNILTPYPLFQWQHELIRYDGVNASIFRMGQLEAQAARTGTITAPVGNMSIGSGNGAVRFWAGPAAEVKFWTRALTDQEVPDVYAGVDNAGIRSGIASEWSLISNANDTTGANNGTLNGSPTFTSTDVPFSLRVATTGRVATSNRTVIT